MGSEEEAVLEFIQKINFVFLEKVLYLQMFHFEDNDHQHQFIPIFSPKNKKQSTEINNLSWIKRNILYYTIMYKNEIISLSLFLSLTFVLQRLEY